MEDFVNFEVAKKLKEKGFSCKYPFAMYDEDGVFYPLFTSCDEDEDSKCIFGNRMYYDYDDFIKDEDTRIAPTISQVLKWLREEKNIILTPNPSYFEEDCCLGWDCDVWASGNYDHCCVDYKTYEEAAIAGIEYVLDNII